jgi:flagellar FliJ protein
MNPIAALQVLLERAEQERDNARAALRQAETMVERAQAQSRQLEQYRGDYDQRWTRQFRTQGTPELLHCRQSFGERLDLAIGQQQAEVRNLGNRVQRASELLLERERRVAAVRKLIERRQQELRLQAERRDQRQTDEAAQRAHTARAAHPRRDTAGLQG